MASFIGPEFVQKELFCATRPAFIGTRLRGSSSVCRLSVEIISECLPAVLFSGRA